MRKFGLIGFPLGHSFSQGYFTSKFKEEGIIDCLYENYPLPEINKLTELIQSNQDIVGINVTIPYKEQVLQYLNEIDDEAKAIGAVNTIKVTRDKGNFFLKGYNTDVYGFKESLIKVFTPKSQQALILGTGGAAKAVVWTLESLNINYRFVSRNPKRTGDYSYQQLTREIIQENKLIINTSPVGMYPYTDKAPELPYEGIGPEHVLFDLIYNPEKTLFLKYGEQKKATTLNGLPMLYLQAEKAWEIWNRD